MPAGPPYGNKNAEKWTLRKATQLFHDAIELTNEKQGEGYKYDFIGEIARELGTFKDIFNHLVKRFPSLNRVKLQLDTAIEQNCYWNTKKGLIKEGTGIVNLKSNWRWTDRIADTHSVDDDMKELLKQFKVKKSDE